MSALSGLGAKGEKGKGKYTSININNIYKGTSAPQQKSAATTRQHGLQSLGKVGGTRRMPPPAHLPSLRSENCGNDPNVNLVPTGSSGSAGWGAKEEQALLEQQQLQQQQQQHQQQQQSRPVVETQQQQAPVKKTPEPGGRPQPSLQPQPAIVPSQQSQGQQKVTGGTGQPPQGANIPQGANQQISGGNPQQVQSNNNSSNAGGKSWSSITMGGNKKAGGFLDQKSPFFQEEFPSLVSGGEENSPQPKKEEEKEPQYGPGPSLRPQNVGNWKEGGGRGAMQQQIEEQQNGGQMSGGAASPGQCDGDQEGSGVAPPPGAQVPPQAMMRPGQPMGPIPPGAPMMPPQFRGMMPPYMFGPRGFPPGYPPNFHPGMQRPPYHYPDQRMRAPHPGGPHMGPDGRRGGGGGGPGDDNTSEAYKRPAIIKDQDLKDFDDLLNSDAQDGGWAGAQGEIDYSEKIVFSDDEDSNNQKDRDYRNNKDHREHERYSNKEDRRDRRGDGRDDRKERDLDYDHRDNRKDDRPRSRDSDRDRPEYERQKSGDHPMGYGPREAWAPHPGQYGRGPVDRQQWQGQIPFDHRGPPGGFPPQFRMGPRGPVQVPPGQAPPNQARLIPPMYPPASAAPTSPQGSVGSAGPPTSPGSSPKVAGEGGDDDDHMWKHRRRQQNEQMSEAVERARQRREEEERRIEMERKAAAQEKLRRLEDKLRKEDGRPPKNDGDTKSEGSDAEGGRQNRSRTASESSDKGFNKTDKYTQGGQFSRQFAKNVPPRFQKQHTHSGDVTSGPGPTSPQPGPNQLPPGQTSPGMRQGPQHWFDPRAGPWGGMPPPPGAFLPGRPIDMPGWEEQMRRGGPMPPHHPYFDQRNFPAEYERHDERYDDRYGYDDKHKEDHEPDKGHPEVREREHQEFDKRPPSRDRYDEQPPHREPKYKDDRRDRKDSKDSQHSRDSKKDRDERSERERPPRPQSGDHRRSEEKQKRDKDSRDVRDSAEPDDQHNRSRDSFQSDGWDRSQEYEQHQTFNRNNPFPHHDHPKFRGRNEWGQQQHHQHGYAAPPPISAQQAQQNLPPRSNYTSLKRSHSNAGAQNHDRKADSSKDSHNASKSDDKSDKPHGRDSGKENRNSRESKANDKREHVIEEEKEPKSKGRDDKSEKSKFRDDRQDKKDDRKKRDDRQKKDRKDDRRDDRRNDRRDDQREDRRDKERGERPPNKRMKDDDRSYSRGRGNRTDNQDDRGSKTAKVGRGGGGGGSGSATREFVGRGRGTRGRSAGVSAVKGRSAGGRGRGEYRSLEGRGARYNSEGRGGGKMREWSASKKEDSDLSEGEDFNEVEHVDSRRRTKGEESDVSVDDASASVSESSSDKATDSREGSKPKEMPKPAHVESNAKPKIDGPPARDIKNPWGLPNTQSRAAPSPDKGTFPTPDVKSDFRDQMRKDEQHKEHKREDRRDDRKDERRDDRREKREYERRDDRRDRGERGDRGNRRNRNNDGKGRGGGNRHDRDGGDAAGFQPRGEPSRRGRGSGYERGDRGRGRGHRGRGGSDSQRSHNSNNFGGENKMAFKAENLQQQLDSQDFGGRWEDKENKTQKHDGKDYRWERNSVPPRFSRSASGGRGGRGGFGERGRGRGGRGGREGGGGGGIRDGASGGRGNSHSARGNARIKPQLTKQNSSDMGNEEWETASESSDVLDRRDSKNELKDQSGKEKERKEAKKSFSSQRPTNDRQNRRANSAETRNSVERGSKTGSKERSPSSKMNGAAPNAGRNGNQTKANKTLANSSKKENTSAVYRMDEIVLQDPTAVHNAINSIKDSKSKTSKKSSDLSDVSKPLKSEKEKKTDALANIDINNYASVVVIDDQPEVSIDDPAFFFESNEGFQEVTSKKQQKKTIKAAQEEAARLKVQDEKKEKPKKGKSRGASSTDNKRMSKLPPRLAKQRAEKEKEKQQHTAAIEAFMPKIEAWDNELANNIPPPAGLLAEPQTENEPQKVVAHSSPASASTPSLNGSFSMGMPLPAPAPAVNAWEKPISITPAVVPSSVAQNTDVKFDGKADQHDSGIDVSEPQNSNSSSTRSSPSAENKLMAKIEKITEESGHPADMDVMGMKVTSQYEAPKPQRQPKSANRMMEKPTKPVESNRVVKKPEILKEKSEVSVIASSKAPVGLDPIQLPASLFKFTKGEESSDIKLDFTFDAELAKLTEEKAESKDMSENMQNMQPMSIANSTSRVPSLQSPTSPATEDLNLKIASVKNVWETMPSMPTVFEHKMQSGPPVSNVSVSETEPVVTAVSAQHSYSSYGSPLENVNVVSDMTKPSQTASPSPMSSVQEATVSVETVTRKQEMSANAEPFVVSSLTSQPMESESLPSYMDTMIATSQVKAMVSEQSNVCKVKPQQQNIMHASSMTASMSSLPQSIGLGSMSLPSSSAPSIQSLGPLSGIASPPSQPTQQPAAPQQQQQQQQTQPVIIAAQLPQYHPFPTIGSSQLVTPENRAYTGTYGTYGLSQQPQAAAAAPLSGQTAFSQPSLFLQTGATVSAQSDLYGTASQVPSQYRSQYGSTQQPNTIMVSSTSSTLMSSAIKPPTAPSQFGEYLTGSSMTSGKSNPLATLQYGQIVNTAASLQPSGMYLSFDPSQSALANTNQPPPAAQTQNLTGSQIIGSQLVQTQRPAVQTVQPQSSFYSQQTPTLQQTGFYQGQQANTASNLGPMQQVSAQPTQYSVQGYGTQPPTGLSLSLQPSTPAAHALNLGNTSTLNKAAAPFKPAAQQHQTATQLKSPPISAAANANVFASANAFQSSSSFPASTFSGSFQSTTTTTQSVISKLPQLFNAFPGLHQSPTIGGSHQSTPPSISQIPPQQQSMLSQTPNFNQPPPSMKPTSNVKATQQYQPKMNTAYVGQSSVQPTGGMLPTQLMVGIRPSAPPQQQAPSQTRFQNPIQRPANMMMPPQSTGRQQTTGHANISGPNSLLSATSSYETRKPQAYPQSTPPNTGGVISSSSSAGLSSKSTAAAGGGGGPASAAFRAQQAKQRAELLAHAQSFLNPSKKPAPSLGEAEISDESKPVKTDDAKPDSK